jgi:hypothetical protein
MRHSILIACALLAGCTIVNDPGRHQHGGQRDAGADAGQLADAGPEADAGVDGGPRMVQGQDVCTELAVLYCDAYFDCCSAAATRTETAFDMCLSDVSASCASGDGNGPAIASLVADPRTGYDPQVAGEVLTEGEALVASCSLDLLRWTAERSGFQRVLTGTIARGEACTPRDVVPPGADYPALFSCEGTDSACVAGGGRWSCLARQPAGASCVLYWDCEDGHFCQGVPFLGATCQPRKANGMPCSGAIECVSLFCSDAMMCETPTQDDVYCPVAD